MKENSLFDQWVSLTEERNAVNCAVSGTEIPGASAVWDLPSGMESHIPVIFLDLISNSSINYFVSFIFY